MTERESDLRSKKFLLKNLNLFPFKKKRYLSAHPPNTYQPTLVWQIESDVTPNCTSI